MFMMIESIYNGDKNENHWTYDDRHHDNRDNGASDKVNLRDDRRLLWILSPVPYMVLRQSTPTSRVVKYDKGRGSSPIE